MRWMRLLIQLSFPTALLLAGGCNEDKPSPSRSPAPATAPVTDVEARVIEIVAEQMGLERARVSRRTHLKRDLKADELDTVELVMELEDTFNISIADQDAVKLQTVGDMIDYVRARR